MNKTKTLIITEGAVIIALATVLSFIKIYKIPWGGSVTMLSMLPIVMFSIRHGIAYGIIVSSLYSVIQLGQGIAEGLLSWNLTFPMLIACIFIDYISAYSVIGLAGIFRSRGIVGWISGTVIVIFLRFICHFVSGVVIFKSFGSLWSGFSTDNIYIYSLLYNTSYMLPEMIVTSLGAFVIFRLPQAKRILKN